MSYLTLCHVLTTLQDTLESCDLSADSNLDVYSGGVLRALLAGAATPAIQRILTTSLEFGTLRQLVTGW